MYSKTAQAIISIRERILTNKEASFKTLEWATFTSIALMYLYIISNNMAVLLSDSFDFYARAQVIFDFKLKDMVNGLHPLGYPMLLKVFFTVTNDYVVASKTISFLSSMLCLFSFYKICNFFFIKPVSLFSTLLLSFNYTYLYLSVSDCTDLACLGFGYLAIYYFILATKHDDYLKYYLISSAVLGLSYLMRYQALTILPAMLAYILFLEQRASFIKRKDILLLFVTIFCVVTSVQLVSSYLLKGSPFWTIQYANIWFGIHGDFSRWGEDWEKARSYTGIFQIINESPSLFFEHCKKNLIVIFRDNMAEIPLYAISTLGVSSLLYYSKTRKSGLFLLAIFFTYSLALSMTLVMPRYLLITIPLWILFVVSGINFLLQFDSGFLKKYQISALVTPLIILSTHVFYKKVWKHLQYPIFYQTEDVKEVSNYFNRIGIFDEREILSLGTDYHFLNLPLKTRIYNPRYSNQSNFNGLLESPTQVINYMKEHGFEYLVYDKETAYWFPNIQNFISNPESDNYFSTLLNRRGIIILRLD